MEPQRRLSARKWIWVGWTFAVLAFIGCNSPELQTEPAVVVAGIDPFCETRPKIDFCEDFDTLALPGVFDEQSSDLSTMTLDRNEASSAPHSLLIAVESGGHGELKHTFERREKLRLFGMLFVSELGEGNVKIGSFELGDYRVGFGASEDGSLWAYEGEERLDGNGVLPVGRWVSFRWDVNIYGDGTGSANLRFGNDVIVDIDELHPPVETADSPVATIGLSEATGAWRVQFDNLTVAVKDTPQ